MRAPFSPQANVISRLLLVLFVLGTVGGFAFAALYENSPAWNAVERPVEQPILFDHRHHVQGLGLDCRYCHVQVENGAHAGFPDTATCMGCHSEIWPTSPALNQVRVSLKAGRPIRWRAVNALPDYVYFNHSIHLRKGIGCASCHGDLSQTDAVAKHRTFLMRDCLSCHEDPTPFLRAPDDPITTAGHSNTKAEALERAHAWGVGPLPITDCRVCHR